VKKLAKLKCCFLYLVTLQVGSSKCYFLSREVKSSAFLILDEKKPA